MQELIAIFHKITGQIVGPNCQNNQVGINYLCRYFYKNCFEPKRIELIDEQFKTSNKINVNKLNSDLRRFKDEYHIAIVKSEHILEIP